MIALHDCLPFSLHASTYLPIPPHTHSLSGVEDAAAVFAGEDTLTAIPVKARRAVACVSSDPQVRALPVCAAAAAGTKGRGGRQLVLDPLASRVEMAALVEGGACVFRAVV